MNNQKLCRKQSRIHTSREACGWAARTGVVRKYGNQTYGQEQCCKNFSPKYHKKKESVTDRPADRTTDGENEAATRNKIGEKERPGKKERETNSLAENRSCGVSCLKSIMGFCFMSNISAFLSIYLNCPLLVHQCANACVVCSFFRLYDSVISSLPVYLRPFLAHCVSMSV